MDLQKEREAFEKWAFQASEGWASFVKSHGDNYENDKLQFAWKAWQAAKAQAVPDGFVVVPKEPTQEMIQAGLEKVRESWDDAPVEGFDSFTWGDMVATWKAVIEAQEQDYESK